jgi:hypothetical protein
MKCAKRQIPPGGTDSQFGAMEGSIQ